MIRQLPRIAMAAVTLVVAYASAAIGAPWWFFGVMLVCLSATYVAGRAASDIASG